MPEFHTIALFLAAGLALNLTPGPDMLYVATRSAAEGRKAGIASALGIAAGCLVHLAALAFGLSAVLATVPLAYDVVRYLGAAYLIYLGVRALLRPQALLAGPQLTPQSLGRVFRQGMLTNVLNPKVALFFLALLPQFVDSAQGPLVPQIVMLGLLFNVTGTFVNLGVALLASRATTWLQTRPGPQRVAHRITGAVFVGLGLRLAYAKQS